MKTIIKFKKLLTVLTTLYVLHLSVISYSQGVAINTTGTPAFSSAILDVKSNSKGLLIPRLTTFERNAINNPAEGLQIFNTTTKCFEAYVNNTWYYMSCQCPPPASPTANINTTDQPEIIWNWNAVSGADGYKYNTINDYNSATDNGTSTTYLQTGLNCNTQYNLYVWAYNSCAPSDATILTDVTDDCFNCGDNFLDIRDGITYQTVQIGTQCWMKENLNYDDNSGNSWCYDNNSSNCSIYGRLYIWSALMNGSSGSISNPSGVQGLCPVGWHIPSDAEWTELTNYLGGESIAGGKLKGTGTIYWNSPNTGATNSSNFSARAGGYKDISNFYNINLDSFWWSTTEDGSDVWVRNLLYNNNAVLHYSTLKVYGGYVRCIKD